MKLKVNKDKCTIIENEIWNVGDYNVHIVQVELSDDFDGLVNKVRYFVEDKCYDMLIENNIAQIPYEATKEEGPIEIGVYGFDADTDILVQSTRPVVKYISSGTYTGEPDNTEPLTPSDKQQMEAQIQQNSDDIDELDGRIRINTNNISNLQQTKADKTQVNTLSTQVQANTTQIGQNKADITALDNRVDQIPIVTKTSQLTNDSGFITKDVNNLTYYTTTANLSRVALTGNYNDLTNKPNLSSFATTTELGNETTARENADIGLQGQIDAITSSSDVKDIVGTYTELQNYETSTLGNDDIIKVLQDSTHNEAMTYYRWVISGGTGSWQYVGQEGPYYTKSETETLLNNKQNEITSSNKLNSDLVNDENQTNKFVTENEKTTWNTEIENLHEEDELLKRNLQTTTGSGEEVTLEDTTELDFVKPPLPMGNSEQEGEPSPDNEVPITNVTGNVEVTISNENNTESKTLPVSLGNIELCKIGNYQDYLYKNNGKWYLHKEIKKILLNGTEGWSVSNNVFYLTSISDYINSSGKICLSDKYTAINNTSVGTSEITQNNSICFFITNTNPRLYIRDERFNNVNAFKAELSENNVKVYYPTVTPTDTEITDATLISQLEEISKTLSYQGQTNITSNTIAMFDVEAYQDLKIILTDYVKNTDYATSVTGGVVKTGYSINVDTNGNLYVESKSYSDYDSMGSNNAISKGTLENVITGRALENKYSSSEIKTGTWIDNKPVYRRIFTINLGTAPNIAQAHSLTNLDKFWINQGASFVFSSYESLPSTWYYSSADWARTWMTNATIRFRSPVDLTNRVLWVAVEYTKTTD